MVNHHLSKTDTIKKVHRFTLGFNKLIIAENLYPAPEYYFRISALNGQIIDSFKSITPLQEPYINKCSIWVNDFNGKGITYVNNTFTTQNFNIKEYDCEYNLWLSAQKNNNKKVTSKVDSNGNSKWLYEDSISIFYKAKKTIFLSQGNLNQLIALNNQTGEELWSYTLPEKYSWTRYDDTFIKASITKILGLYDNKVWLVISNNGVVGIDVEIGKEIVFISHIPDIFAKGFSQDKKRYTESHGFGGHNLNSQLDIEKGIIFTPNGSYYGEIDLQSDDYRYTAWDLSQALQSQPSASKTFPFSICGIAGWINNIVYIYDKDDSHCYGAFDRETKTILWSEVFEDDAECCGGIFNMKVASNYIYIHARSDRSLHIYQQQQVEVTQESNNKRHQ